MTIRTFRAALLAAIATLAIAGPLPAAADTSKTFKPTRTGA